MFPTVTFGKTYMYSRMIEAARSAAFWMKL